VLHAVLHRLGDEQAKVLSEHRIELGIQVVECKPCRRRGVWTACQLEIALSRAQQETSPARAHVLRHIRA
jgi:hypothetical protein